MCSQMFRCAMVYYAMILDSTTVEAVVRVRMAVMALPISVTKSGGERPGLSGHGGDSKYKQSNVVLFRDSLGCTLVQRSVTWTQTVLREQDRS